MTLDSLTKEYEPYNAYPEFKEGFVDYQLGKTVANYHTDVQAQAYDRGQEWPTAEGRGSTLKEASK